MRDPFRRDGRFGLLALVLAAGVAAVADLGLGIPVGDRLRLSGLALWAGIAGAGLSLGWLAAVVGAYRLVDGKPTVDTWLERERQRTVGSGFGPGLTRHWLAVTTEALILRGLLLPVAGGLAVVAAAGLWRWPQGRRSTLWGMAQALVLTAVTLLSGNLVAGWLAHGLADTLWLGYLTTAIWRRSPTDAPMGEAGTQPF